MSNVTIEQAREIIAAARAHARAGGMRPLGIVVLDAGGNVTAFEREDGASNKRFEIAHGKAYGALGFGIGSRTLADRAREAPAFYQGANAAFGGQLIPAPGGVLIRDDGGNIVGAVGVSGDNSDNDEQAAVAGIEAAGFSADPG